MLNPFGGGGLKKIFGPGAVKKRLKGAAGGIGRAFGLRRGMQRGVSATSSDSKRMKAPVLKRPPIHTGTPGPRLNTGEGPRLKTGGPQVKTGQPESHTMPVPFDKPRMRGIAKY